MTANQETSLRERLLSCAKGCEVYSPDQCATLIDGIGWIAMRALLREAADAIDQAYRDGYNTGRMHAARAEPQAGECPYTTRCDCIGACKHGFAGNGAAPSPASRARPARNPAFVGEWHAKAVALGYDGVADLLSAVERGDPPTHVSRVLASAGVPASLARPEAQGSDEVMTDAEVRQWIDACNYGKARDTLRHYLALRSAPPADRAPGEVGECAHTRSHAAPWRCAKCGNRMDTHQEPAR